MRYNFSMSEEDRERLREMAKRIHSPSCSETIVRMMHRYAHIADVLEAGPGRQLEVRDRHGALIKVVALW